MGLRARVAFTLAAAIIPISFVFSLWRIGSDQRDMMERRVERFASRLQDLDSGECRNRRPRPRRRGLRHRPPRQFEPLMYSEQLAPHRDAPPFPKELRDVLESDDPVHFWMLPGKRLLGATAVRIAEQGPCAVALIPWRPHDAPAPPMRSAVTQTFGLAAILAVLGMLVSVPIVRRIRRLEEAVRRAKGGHFDVGFAGNDEITALADAFSDTLSALHEREMALEQYIANTTHDLAIPLTVLQHRLRKLASLTDSDDARVALEESHYIASLIANMRTAAKLEATSELDLAYDVDLTEIVERVVQRHLPIAEQKGVELNWATPETRVVVQGEPTLTEQALSNLVQNAVQYNAPGGHVSIVLEDLAGGFELSVADDGPGVPEQLRESVMKRGVRDDAARTRNAGGQGFGLAIVQRVVTLHDWTIEFEHEPGLLVRIRGSGRRI